MIPGRGIPSGGVARRSNTLSILTPRALPRGRRPPGLTPRITVPGTLGNREPSGAGNAGGQVTRPVRPPSTMSGERGVNRQGRTSVFSLILVLVGAGPGLAQSAGTSAPPPQEQRPPAWTTSSGLSFTLFPVGDVHPLYMANPHRPTNTILGCFYTTRSIAFSGNPRVWLSAGGRFGLLRVGNTAPGARVWQIGLEAGMDALFDAEHKSENIGWDGNYGLTLTTGSAAPWTLKVAMLHTSAHIGDEHADRTGRTRINYIREELAIGGAYRMGRAWRTYGELGGAYIRGAGEQEPWRLQGGLEYRVRAAALWRPLCVVCRGRPRVMAGARLAR